MIELFVCRRVGRLPMPYLIIALAAVLWVLPTLGRAQTNLVFRVMAANLTGDSQVYAPPAIRIFQGLKPDVVAIQEFNCGNNTTDIRTLVDTAFGTQFHYYRESGYSIPNGIISRYPIRAAGSWLDTV